MGDGVWQIKRLERQLEQQTRDSIAAADGAKTVHDALRARLLQPQQSVDATALSQPNVANANRDLATAHAQVLPHT